MNCFCAKKNKIRTGATTIVEAAISRFHSVPAVLTLKCLQAQSEREQLLILQIDERAEKVVPGSHEGKQGNDGEGGLGEGEDHLPENLPFRAAVNLGRFRQLEGQRHKELPQQKDEKGVAEPRRYPERTKTIPSSPAFGTDHTPEP